jgi:hypothetical protein
MYIHSQRVPNLVESSYSHSIPVILGAVHPDSMEYHSCAWTPPHLHLSARKVLTASAVAPSLPGDSLVSMFKLDLGVTTENVEIWNRAG